MKTREIAGPMDAANKKYALRLLVVIHVINALINILGASITFVWFSHLQPGLTGGGDLIALRDRAIFSLVLVSLLSAIGLPIELRWLGALVKQLNCLKNADSDNKHDSEEFLRHNDLVTRLINVPIKLSLLNLGLWATSGVIFAVAPFIFPEYCPWDEDSAAKISAWSFFLGAPIVIVLGYFVSEFWIRKTVEGIFPAGSLLGRPHGAGMNAFPRLLIVTLMVGIMPPALISHVTLRQIADIRNGFQSIDSFLVQMPVAINFLLCLTVVLAVILSAFLAHSISEPLRKTEIGMRRIGTGDLEARVKVVSRDEIGSMGEGFNMMAEGLKERAYIRETFGSYLSDEIVREILHSPDGGKLGGELRNITILVSDLRGFTPLTESLEPHIVVGLLNRYFERMTDVIISHSGIIDEFVGDGILVFFGAPQPLQNHEQAAVFCAIEMQEALKRMNQENRSANLPELRMGIGVNSGEVIVGNIGSDKRKKYGAVGSPINIAFRVQSLAGAGEIIITPSVYERLDSVEATETRETTLKGFDKTIVLRSVFSLTHRS